jgi:hypothetical protein
MESDPVAAHDPVNLAVSVDEIVAFTVGPDLLERTLCGAFGSVKHNEVGIAPPRPLGIAGTVVINECRCV